MLNLPNAPEVKFLEIVFENCESIVIPTDRLDDVLLGGITASLWHQSHVDFRMDFDYSCDFARFTVKYNDPSDLIYEPSPQSYPLGMFVGNPTSNSVEDRPNILGRILGRLDITQLHFLGESKSEIFAVYVPYDEEYGGSNGGMDVKVDEIRKEIHVVITEKEDE